jgi:L-ascorbate metabolism protein UlaG (beta-lactamase superfamily)
VGGFGMAIKVLKLFLTNKEERIPRCPLGPFRTDTKIYQQPPASGLRITWMGHSSLLIEIDSVTVLIDPVWDPRASPRTWFGPKRFFAPPLPLAALPPIDLVLISHNHYDHLGKSTIQTLAKLPSVKNAQWVTSLGVAERLRKFGVPAERIKELNWTESLTLAQGLTITALPARHFSGRGVFDRFTTLWSSFTLKSARHNIYYGADSGMWNGFAEIARQYGPFDLTMLEIGAFNELWKSIHLGPDGAAQAFTDMGASGLLMPIHWGLFDLALHGWRQPIARMTELADNLGFELWAPEPGAPTDVIRPYRSNWWLTHHESDHPHLKAEQSPG